MFRLSAFADRLREHYLSHPESIFPVQHYNYTLKSLDDLEDISVSRPRSRLSWGIPVPDDPAHTIYVWIDALANYLTAVGYPNTTTTWPPDLQVIGKDIVKFHTVYFPAMLMALGLPLQKRVLAHAHWTSAQKKMSKSVGNTTDPFAAMDMYGVDQVRYFMAIVGGNFRTDVDWSELQLKKEVTELKNVLGNFLMRITSAKIRGIVATGEVKDANDARYDALRDMARGLPDRVAKEMDGMEVGAGLKAIMDMLRLVRCHLHVPFHRLTMVGRRIKR